MSNRILIIIVGVSVFVATVAVGLIFLGNDDPGAPAAESETTSTELPATAPDVVETTTTSTPATTEPPQSATAPSIVPTEPEPDAYQRVLVNCTGPYEFRDFLPLVACTQGFGVTLMQEALIEARYTLEADGYFGQSTADAIQDFQAQNGLDPSGEADVETWGALVGERPGYDINGDGVIGPNEIIYD